MAILTEYGFIAAKGIEEVEIADRLEYIVSMIGRVDNREEVQTKKHIGPWRVFGPEKVYKKQQEC